VTGKRRGPRANPLALAASPTAAPEVPPTASPTPQEAKVTPPRVAPPTQAQPPAAPIEPVADMASLNEVLAHAAEDSLFFCKHFFPDTFRQDFAEFHPKIFDMLDDPAARYINLQVMRDGAKTTLIRAYMAKRVAYKLSRTILYIGASQDKAKASVGWLRKQIERNKRFSQTFGLSKGGRWTDEYIEIKHGPEGVVITVIALGITGSVRGINIDDYRPDLIIPDDTIGDDNSATPEQRHKLTQLILGAVKESLSPASETPDAKLVICNTPLDFEDLSQKALRDPQFRSARFGCWTPETEDLPIEMQESSWPERYPTATLRKEKEAAIARNELSVFAREKECRLITPETSSFRAEWLKYFGPGEEEAEPPAAERWVEIVIDPVPPPSEIQIAKGLAGKDFEAITAVARHKNKYYVLETSYNRGHQPNWTVAEVFAMCNRWTPRKIIVEAVAYQRALAWLLREGMKHTGRFYAIEEFNDKRKKQARITQGLAGPLSNGAVYVRRTQTALISQIIHYPGKNPDGTHDDVLETVAIGVASLSRGWVGDSPEDDFYLRSEKSIPELEYRRGAP
jgi:hypothetical protein